MADYSGAESIGFLLGGGAKQIKQQSYDEGRLNTARTEEALARAREKQLEAQAKAAQEREFEALGDQIAATGDPNAALITAMMRAGRGNAGQLGAGLLAGQQFGHRQTLADPDAPIGDQFAAGQGVQGKVLPRLAPVGEGNFLDLLDEEPELAATPVGESVITRNVASANLSDERRINPQRFLSASGSPSGFGKPPSGFVDNPNFDPSRPINGDNPVWIRGTQQDMGARGEQMLNRVIGGATQARATLRNFLSLPITVSSGVFGLGSAPGPSLLKAGVDTLRNKVSEEDTQRFNTMLASLNRNLAFVEGHGLATSTAFAESYDALTLREGDTELTKLTKLADVAQTIEEGLQPYMVSQRVSPEQKRYMQGLITEVRKLIPFTQEDVSELVNAGNPNRTISDVIQEKGLDKVYGAQPLDEPAQDAPQEGDIELDDEGNQWQFGGGDPADPQNWFQVVP